MKFKKGKYALFGRSINVRKNLQVLNLQTFICHAIALRVILKCSHFNNLRAEYLMLNK